MWPSLVQTAKEGGEDTIESYVFWNGHELSPGKYSFDGRFDLIKFVKIVQQAGMYMIMRIGPFVAVEYNFGGIPVWLHYIPGTVFRTDNEPFKYYMQRFTTVIVNLMKKEKLFASLGGPIILSQALVGFFQTSNLSSCLLGVGVPGVFMCSFILLCYSRGKALCLFLSFLHRLYY
ncbi:hypothetical protein Dsin_009092 [Dipteronia sinensis]|uniref:beta-galactosidase n=1 Tax=Dipteronia sinensis TaxID=43782 RepID=A0AAE0EBR9_9ROSI|nr:hypothetical protein Dsin_009092 [Dipteronia sinensis]